MRRKKEVKDTLPKDPWRWIVDRPWLRHWITAPRVYTLYPEVGKFYLQIFRSVSYEELERNLILAFVFGKKRINKSFGYPMRQMAGFWELTGRLPTEDDEPACYVLLGRDIQLHKCGECHGGYKEVQWVCECAIIPKMNK